MTAPGLGPSAWVKNGAAAFFGSLRGDADAWRLLLTSFEFQETDFLLAQPLSVELKDVRLGPALALLGLFGCSMLTCSAVTLSAGLFATSMSGSAIYFRHASALAGLTAFAWVSVATLEGVALASRAVVMAAWVGAISLTVGSVWPEMVTRSGNAVSVGYPVISVAIGCVIGFVASASRKERRAIGRMFAMAAVVSAGGVAVYYMARRYPEHPGWIAGMALTGIGGIAWLLGRGPVTESATVGGALKAVAPLGLLALPLSSLARETTVRPEDWDYGLWVGALVGGIVPVWDSLIGRVVGWLSVVATPMTWTVVVILAFQEFRDAERVTTIVGASAGVLLGVIGARLWTTTTEGRRLS